MNEEEFISRIKFSEMIGLTIERIRQLEGRAMRCIARDVVLIYRCAPFPMPKKIGSRIFYNKFEIEDYLFKIKNYTKKFGTKTSVMPFSVSDKNIYESIKDAHNAFCNL